MDRIIEKKKWTPKKIIWIALGTIFGILVFYNLFFGDHTSKFNVQRDRISIEEVQEDFFQDYITQTGTVEPISTIYLDAMEGGRVEEILIEEGTMVQKGDAILRLSNTNLHLDIMNREANLAEQINNLRNTRLSMEQNKLSLKRQMLDLDYEIGLQKRNYENSIDLYEKDYISDKQFEEVEEKYNYLIKTRELVIENQKADSLFRDIQVAQLENSVDQMEMNLEFVRQKLENLIVKAPVSGLLVTVNAEIGEAIGTGQRLGQIHVLDSYKIRLEIDEHYISRVNSNLVGEFDFNSNTYQLRIKKIYPEVRNGRFGVDLVFVDEVPDRIRTGQTFRVKLELGQSEMAILVPRGGFYQSTGGQYIFVLEPTEKFAIKRDIRLGRMNPRYYEVLEGLQPGEKVIVSSYDNFGRAEKLILK
ncbi:MAG: efflux RND transporter periplasmic adaptor subunit [Candidatus Cloacimonetes bacterium]|nr:efflux RND transporter periplasmic adaptor subunit [Candidatus Cloacimonadota bacterium]MCF7813616.1 efflux RND transporter periplasmic adaptor subunit [Candidatus Cloacimonadota bacterium]MCF7867932.1 efflux RND transporter periplasmic adaptor subunit [Candidatus Cloacimonadota bacterium]MCF7882875.1 efflux RND transporter periplasmic adaptor subunit [Candidatus Cloacimonadota bacterium]